MKLWVTGAVAACAIVATAISATAQESLQSQFAGADLKKGEKAYKKCKSCHTIDSGGKNKVGPNIYGIIGKQVAAVSDYKYSKALIDYGGEWTLERLDAFLKKPKKEVKGTKMGFAGIKKDAQRLDLLAYLNANSDVPLSADPGTPAETAESAEDDGDEYEFGVLFSAPGVEETFYACSACHSERIVAQQGLTREGWEEMLEWMVDEQEMDEIDEPGRSIILDYLSKHYGVDRPNFPKS